jgi:prepilin-type N-terminal cleavage/methylation domain-containing protein
MNKFKTWLLGSRPGRGRRATRGMTLIEVLIGVAISAVVMIALLELYVTGQKYFFNQNSRTNTIEESRVPMVRISRDIRDASRVADGPVTAFDGQEYSTSDTCLVLEVPSIDGLGMPIAGSTDYIVYSYDAATLRLYKVVSANGGVRENRVTTVADNIIGDGSGGPPFKLKFFRSDGSAEVTSNYGDPDNGAFIVEVELTAQGRSIQRDGQNFVETVRTQATLRNKIVPIPG